ncbi:uncharacterized protein LOC135844339 [Planococcus citri]|uniref:uncharacterized protein LOC135844339 n=1 Tax=Planococcus citri TaxID=170843 RepID=UPI0031F83378
METELQFKLITKDEKPEIRQFLLDNYFPDDQILLSNGRVQPTEGEIQFMLDIIDENLSFKAYNRGELCGIILNGEFDRNCVQEQQQKVDSCRCEIFKKILEFFLAWEIDTHRWEILECDKVFNIHVIAVKSSYRRKGIMKALVNRSLECAKQLEHTSVTVDCTSFYTAKYFQKTDWNCIFSLPFVHFKDNQGNPIFVKKNSPHLHVTTFHLQI